MYLSHESLLNLGLFPADFGSAHVKPSPLHLARRIPGDTWKTVTDAWNGYHSVPLRVSDRRLTTIVTPFGRWRYIRAPQGFLSSGDGYNHRFDAILSDFERKERCVDDTIHYDTDLEHHWWRTIDFLTRRKPSKCAIIGQAIIGAIREGVEIYDMRRRTCLRPDWSRRGIGYFLVQQHCSCTSGIPDCCPGGWRITLAGSRFLSSAEQHYAAIEGEALAMAWGLEQTRYFTQGCDNLVVVTDHKPLLKIFGDGTLDEITNSRLFRLKQRTLPWRFDIVYLPGKSNHAADATSRHPCLSGSANGLSMGLRSVPDTVESCCPVDAARDLMPRVVVPQAADGPRDSALDTSPPEPPGEASSGLGAQDVPVPTGVDPDASLPASQSPHLGQPCRTKMPPRRKEPETGRWIQD
ncbi:uncharacterized protein LOC132462923 [Gadus macrocephalus]|uniref:uncharacterized protein LOC132462923 n=1 Tax=Gadus macrocephalus TaxID=80720 RepID=UPI0028CB1ED4|nr:uncharacterized protein LOC132462923 [Gadus macrocephalus]